METGERSASTRTKASERPSRQKQPGNAQCNGILAEYRCPLAGFARTVWPLAKCVQPISCMDKGRRMGECTDEFDPAGYSR